MVALSSTESEYIGLSNAGQHLTWLRHLFDKIDETQTSATDLLCDNKGAIILTKEPQFQARTKHIQWKYHYVRDDLVATNQVEVKYFTTADMVADIFTKDLPLEKHWKFTKQLGLAPSLSGSVKTK
jgi:hypothetical protein